MLAERRRARCEGCGDELDSAGPGNAQYVSGWAINRAKGTNQVTAQERHQRWLCRFCVDKVRDGISLQQEALF